MLPIGVQVHLIHVFAKSYEQRIQFWMSLLLIFTFHVVRETTKTPAIAMMLVVIRADAARS